MIFPIGELRFLTSIARAHIFMVLLIFFVYDFFI